MGQQKNTKKRVLAGLLAVVLAAAMLMGGTYAYLQDETDEVVNNFETNQVLVDLKETTGDEYNIIPGTSQEKDPTVTVNNTVDSYVYVKVTDNTEGLVTYEIADGWKLLDGYDNVYYREVAADADVKEFPVLKDNTVSYDPAIVNSDMVVMNEDGTYTLKEGIELIFQASAIQKTPWNNPLMAYEQDLGWDGVTTEEIAPEEDGFYHVYNENQLAYLTQVKPISELKGATIVLEKNMYLNKHQWTPFSTADSVTFDGNGYTIYGLNLHGGGNYYWGFFRATTGTTSIKDLGIKNFIVWGSDKFDSENVTTNGVGTLVGDFRGTLNIDNCHVSSGYVIGIGKVGGLVGFNSGSGAYDAISITNSSVDNIIMEAIYDAGGIAGLIKRATTSVNISDVSVTGITLYTLGYDTDYVELDTTVVDTDCNYAGLPVAGTYWLQYDYYWGGYATYYNNYGVSSHDCTLEGETNQLANSEIGINTPELLEQFNH